MPLAYTMSNTAVMVINMRVIIVSTETTQGFTVGLTTQGPSGGVWETQPFDVTFDTLEITVSKIVLYAGRNP